MYLRKRPEHCRFLEVGRNRMVRGPEAATGLQEESWERSEAESQAFCVGHNLFILRLVGNK